MTSVSLKFLLSSKTKMAKSCLVCGSLCAYFILFLKISVVLSTNDYYVYDATSQYGSESFVNLDLIDGERHEVHKRDVSDNQSNTPTEKNITTGPLKPSYSTVVKSGLGDHKTDNGVSSNNGTVNEQKILSAKSKLLKVPKTAVSVEPLAKNLGVNGTGQRKEITTPKPVMLKNQSSTLEPLFHNRSPPVNMSNNGTALMDHNEDDLDFFDDEDTNLFNHTLSEHNITQSRNDTHIYYNSSIINDREVGHSYWVNMSNRSDAKINDLLSKSHRRATTIKLSFEFPFYGHLIKNVTIATGGFLYTGDYVHSWLAATQYIAPLMANFDTSISNDSFIRFADNGTSFTVEWEKVALQDKPNEGQFTFQTTLFKNGDIVFVYKDVPLFIKQIEDEHHPVKVGLSDAYIIDRTIFFVRRKTIYEYHRVNFQKENIRNWTVIYLKALPTCLDNKDCVSCLTNKEPSFECRWCPSANRCSTGLDRLRHDWLVKGCNAKQVDSEDMCSHVSGDDVFDKSNTTYAHDENEFHHRMQATSTDYHNNASALGTNQSVKMGVSGIIAILFLIAMISGLAVWVRYAYKNPHTTSGQILIRYRPSQWRWRRGEARYTAATIHM